MDSKRYLTRFLTKEFGNVHYELWKFKGLRGSAEFETNNPSTCQSFIPYFHPEKGPWFIKAENDFIELHFYYSTEKGFVLRLKNNIQKPGDWLMEQLYYNLYLILLEEEIHHKTVEQNVMVESMHSISSSLNLDLVLQKIIRHALRVVPSADAGYLMLFDPDKQRLVPKAPVGFNENIYQFETKVGESITGKVFEDGKSRVYNSTKELLAAMHENNVHPKNLKSILQSARSKFPEGAICVPISIDDHRIGVMITHQWKLKKRLGKEDIRLLEAFATQAAIAIENAQLYSETKEKNNQLQKRQDVHHTLILLSLQNKGIRNVFNGMQRMIEQDVVFFNGLENEFYKSRTGNIQFSDFEIKTLCTDKRRTFYVTTNHGNKFYFYPIYNGQIFLGCLIVTSRKPISEFDHITLEQGATVLALELVNRHTATKLYHRRVYEQFRRLLNCTDQQQFTKYGAELNLNIDGYWAAVILEISTNRNDYKYLDIYVHQLAQRIKNELGTKAKLVYGFYNKIYFLLSLHNETEVYDVKAELNKLCVKIRNQGEVSFHGGISNVYKGIKTINKSYEEANKILTYLANTNIQEVILYEDIGVNRLFLNQPKEEIEQFIHETLGPLIKEHSRYKELEKHYSYILKKTNHQVKQQKYCIFMSIHFISVYKQLKSY